MYVLTEMKKLTVANGKICKAILKIRSWSEVDLITCELWRVFFIVVHQQSWRIPWSHVTCKFVRSSVIHAHLKTDVA